VRLRPARVARVLGLPLSSERIGELFARLDLPFARDGEDFIVTPPSYRFDIEIEEDLIEEIVRLHGYENLPSAAPRALLAMLPQTEETAAARPRSPDAGRLRLSGGDQLRLRRRKPGKLTLPATTG
jgi:phenylalanyl-tRNA synthetase beta subunit